MPVTIEILLTRRAVFIFELTSPDLQYLVTLVPIDQTTIFNKKTQSGVNTIMSTC